MNLKKNLVSSLHIFSLEIKVKMRKFYTRFQCQHAYLAQLNQHQTSKQVMVSVVSSNPTGGNFIFLRYLDANFVQK